MEIARLDPIQSTVCQTIYKQEDDIINVYIMIMIIINYCIKFVRNIFLFPFYKCYKILYFLLKSKPFQISTPLLERVCFT